MADSDAVVAVIREDTALCHPVSHTPAEEQTLLVAERVAGPEDGPLRARTRMKSKNSIVCRCAAFEADVIADLEREAVAVPVARRHFHKRDAVRVLQEHRPAVVAVCSAAHDFEWVLCRVAVQLACDTGRVQ